MGVNSAVRILRRGIAVTAVMAVAGGLAACGNEGHRAARTADRHIGAAPAGSAQPGGPASGSDPRIPPPVPPSRLPDQAVAHWRTAGHLTALPVSAGHRVRLNECASAEGVTAWHEQGYISTRNTPAQEDILSFRDTTGAARAFAAIQSGMDGCQDTLRTLQRDSGTVTDAQVARTAHSTRGSAWSRTWTGVIGTSAAGPQVNHYYLVRHGSTVVVTAFTEFGAHRADAYDTAGDPAVVSVLAAHTAF